MAIVVIAGALVSRLVFWQVLQHARLAADATYQENARLIEPALRGRIYNAGGLPLATDVTHNLVYADPSQIKNPWRTAALLAPVLGQSEAGLQPLLSRNTTYEPLATDVSASGSDRVQQLGLPGIFVEPLIARDYPQGAAAAQVLGFTDTNGAGQYGVEQYYDALLAGRAGMGTLLHGATGSGATSGATPTPSQNGADLYLALDSYVQNDVESELKKAVKKHSADGGTIIVMNPRTGYILGMASTPSFDPNHYSRYSYSSYTNPAIQWTYEPGSTFKIVTMAAGLDTHKITPDTAFNDTGIWTVGNVQLHNWNGLGFGWETMTQVLQHSANVGASFVSSRLGVDLFYRYVKRFGIGRPTGIDLAGEEAGNLPLPGQKDWTIVNQFTNSFGQGLAVTPLQLVRAVGAVANGGVMMKPQIVRRIVYHGHVIIHPPVSQGRVVSAQTARTLTGMLVKSAVGGEAQLGLVKGYDIAAKTGTANVPSPTGGYIPGETIASIVGYAPAYHPRFVVLVIINHPRDTIWGSTAAAPVLHNLFEDLFMRYHVAPSIQGTNQ